MRSDFRDSGGFSFDSGGTKDGGGMMEGGGMDTSGPPNAFTGAMGYASQKPNPSAKTTHNTKMVGVTPGRGVACFSCHGMGGSGPEFMFAGTAFTDQNATMPAVDFEIRVRGADGVGYIAHSDDDGNFWFKKGTATLATPALTGARNSGTTALMTGTITSGDCNSSACHGMTQAGIHIP